MLCYWRGRVSVTCCVIGEVGLALHAVLYFKSVHRMAVDLVDF